MLSHSTLDDIEYSKYSFSKQKSKQKHHRRRHHHSKSKNYASDQCAVCLDDSIVLDTKLFPCSHTFHGECLIQWVTIQQGRKFNCPLCRQDIAHFIQMTGNQQINDQLIQIWNEHYLYNTSQTDIDSVQTDKNIKIATDEPVKGINKIIEPPAQNDNIKIENVQVNVEKVDNIAIEHDIQILMNINSDVVVDNSRSGSSIWKFLWNSPLSILHQQKNNNVYSAFTMLNVLLYPMYQINISIDQIINGGNNNNKDLNDAHYVFVPTGYNVHTVNSNANIKNDSCSEYPTNKTVNMHGSDTFNDDLLSFSYINFESGIFAGICAATTTYLVTQELKYQLHKGFMKGSLRNTFIPICTETVPNIAIFFTTYEHLKKYAFNTNNIDNSYAQTFRERFISAGIASSVSYFINNGIKGIRTNGLLPFRFATFFGGFEFCKDLMSLKHENIGLFGIASAATIGGTVSHGLYYPLLQYKNIFVMGINNVPLQWMKNETIGCEMYHSGLRKEMVARSLFKGWMSSLSKFLPSCVVCSCAFEYSKRYLNNA